MQGAQIYVMQKYEYWHFEADPRECAAVGPSPGSFRAGEDAEAARRVKRLGEGKSNKPEAPAR
ncbi:hypothetical protein GCM10010991_32080 [Gemmobacter aquaticus]|uniref:Uncharacterized protein n=1 Tax=Gemmobacter aquaticus TaxID=490185 RepID=A0A917YMC1_9RHOB|nr:hypothetical protein GCM10010991_32080 [Gemmobacter aquaticus]